MRALTRPEWLCPRRHLDELGNRPGVVAAHEGLEISVAPLLDRLRDLLGHQIVVDRMLDVAEDTERGNTELVERQARQREGKARLRMVLVVDEALPVARSRASIASFRHAFFSAPDFASHASFANLKSASAFAVASIAAVPAGFEASVDWACAPTANAPSATAHSHSRIVIFMLFS